MWATTEPERHKQWVLTEWPGLYFNFGLGGQQLAGFNDLWLPAEGRRHRYFPSGFAAVASRVYGTPPFWLGTQQQKHVVIWLPDRRVRFGELRFHAGEVRVAYETGANFRGRIEAKAAWRARASDAHFEHATSGVIEGTGWMSFQTGDVPSEFSVALTDGKRLLDRRGWSETAGRPPLDHSSLEMQVRGWLIEGEGIQLEYKERLGKENNREFAESVAAFANGSGGIILLGIGDDASIVGFDPRGLPDMVTNIVRSNVTEYIEVGVTKVAIDEKPVWVVRVPEGGRPPYQVGGRTFIRAGATDRSALPGEVRGLTAKLQEAVDSHLSHLSRRRL